jgi:hypothetical protein
MGAAKGNRNSSKILLARGGSEIRPPRNGNIARCGMKKGGGGTCNLGAGWGTDHPGVGRCKWHGGNSLTHKKQAWTLEAQRLLGEEFEIDPINALMWLIRLAAGDVQYWRQEIARIQLEAQAQGLSPSEALLTDEFTSEVSYIAPQLKIAGVKYEQAQERLAKHAKMALDVGIAERAVRLAEAYGETIAMLISNILQDLWAQPQDVLPAWSRDKLKREAQGIVSRRLLELEAAAPFSDVTAEPVEEGDWAPTGRKGST